MPNYGYNQQYGATTPPTQMPGLNTISEYGFGQDPQAALSYWLSGQRPSQSMNFNLQRLMDSIFSRYRGAAMMRPTDPNMTFANYLRNLNPQYEYLRTSPTGRNEEQRRYIQPVRTV